MGRKKKPVIMPLAEQFSIKIVNNQFKEFVDVLDEDRPVIIDLAHVGVVDYASLQLLYSFKRSCEEKDLDFTLQNISEHVKDKIILCGLQKHFLEDSINGSV